MAMRKDKIAGLVGTTIVHIVILLVLLFVFVHRPEIQAEGGVSVMMGNVDVASGDADPMMFTQVDMMETGMSQAETTVVPESAVPSKSQVESLITQEEEKTMEMPAAKEVKNDLKIKKEVAKSVERQKKSIIDQPKEKTEAEKRAEAVRIATEKKVAEEKAAAAIASQSVAGAFGKGTKMGSRGTEDSGEGIEGSQTGNSNIGKSTGVGGYGTFDLNGRSIGTGGLPMPIYNVQDEGRVVVTITVNPGGQVIGTVINKRTNTVNAKLREAAINAAKKARFNSIDGINNQTGTITYYFKLK